MLIVYLMTYATVTSAPATEPTVDAAATVRSPVRETGQWPIPVYPAIPYAEMQDVNPSYLYPYPQMPYYDNSMSRVYYPGYQNGLNGYPQTAVNGYPPYGYQIPSGYPYGTGYQFPNGYGLYQYGK
jgi:hypothetical protein